MSYYTVSKVRYGPEVSAPAGAPISLPPPLDFLPLPGPYNYVVVYANPGDHVVGGGFATNGGVDVIGSIPYGDNGWAVLYLDPVIGTSTVGLAVAVVARCATAA